MLDARAERNVLATHGLPDILAQVDLLRCTAGQKQGKERKAALGQFLTPAPIARLMASLLTLSAPTLHILDAGAGVGSLFAACVAEICQREDRPERISVTAYEVDPMLLEYLHDTLGICQLACQRVGILFAGEIVSQDFIETGVELLQGSSCALDNKRPQCNCAILNPPYKKIQTRSKERTLLKQVGIESSNSYAGFLALAARLLDPCGELVAITPRSFCNGPYFRQFRQHFLQTMSLRHLHVFEQRNQAFRDDNVLQENIVFYAVKGQKQPEKVLISSSTNHEDELVLMHAVAYDRVVHTDDPESFIRIVQDQVEEDIGQSMARFQTSLQDLGLSVSTGKVVDFRASEFLRPHWEPGQATIPLLFPTHVGYGSVNWPKGEARKPDALVDTERTKAWQVPNEHYVLVKRFSAKEEKKRIVAAIYEPLDRAGAAVGFENHLNYFHQSRRGLPPLLARGLAAYLNSTLVDAYFRQFNGHTQVNATDLRNLTYPTRAQLEALGKKISLPFPPQHIVDTVIREELLTTATRDLQPRDPIHVKTRIAEAIGLLKELDLPRGLHNERAALMLLALLQLKPEMPWSQASNALCDTRALMEFLKEHYGKDYRPHPRETGPDQRVHQCWTAGVLVVNPDQAGRPADSPQAIYQIEPGALELLRTFGTPEWETRLRTYLATDAHSPAQPLASATREAVSGACQPCRLADTSAQPD
ncbi:MAG TPA: Eco57I restriction-modification methylase domain-containing protein [Ktedonobacteraceae bacterium]|jgi:adenine-specific DNA-methyltransferase